MKTNKKALTTQRKLIERKIQPWLPLRADRVPPTGKLVPILPPRMKTAAEIVPFELPRDGHFALTQASIREQHADQLSRVDMSPQQVLKASLRVENPKRHLPGTIDRLSFHLATEAKAQAVKELSQRSNQFVSRIVNPSSDFDLTNKSAATADRSNFRILGYFGDGLQLGDRVINESAEVAAALNRQFK